MQCSGSDCISEGHLGSLMVMRHRMEWGSSSGGWSGVVIWPTACQLPVEVWNQLLSSWGSTEEEEGRQRWNKWMRVQLWEGWGLVNCGAPSLRWFSSIIKRIWCCAFPCSGRCLVSCLMKFEMSFQAGEALKRRSAGSAGISGWGCSSERGWEGSMAEGGACWLLRLWVAYMDCRQMSNLMRWRYVNL